MGLFVGLLETLGTIISNVFNIYGSYKQIEDRSETRHEYHHHYERRDTGEDISAIKEMVEKKLIPDIKETTRVVRNVLKEFADSGQQLAKQIKDQLIPDAKTTIKATEDAMNNLKQESQLLSQDIHETLIPEATESMGMFKNALEKVVRIAQGLSEHIEEETLPAVNDTLKVTRDAMCEISNTNHLLRAEISDAAEQLHIGLEIGLICLLLAVAAFCRYELSMMERTSEQNTFHRIEKMMIHILRCICISYGAMRFVVIILLKQAEPVPSEVLFRTFIPVLISWSYDVVKQSNFKLSKPDMKMVFCYCGGFLKCTGKYAGSCVNFTTERITVINQHVCYYFRLLQGCSAQRIRCIKNYILMILRHLGDKLVTAINVESLSLFIWLPQDCSFPLLHLKNRMSQPRHER